MVEALFFIGICTIVYFHMKGKKDEHLDDRELEGKDKTLGFFSDKEEVVKCYIKTREEVPDDIQEFLKKGDELMEEESVENLKVYSLALGVISERKVEHEKLSKELQNKRDNHMKLMRFSLSVSESLKTEMLYAEKALLGEINKTKESLTSFNKQTGDIFRESAEKEGLGDKIPIDRLCMCHLYEDDSMRWIGRASGILNCKDSVVGQITVLTVGAYELARYLPYNRSLSVHTCSMCSDRVYVIYDTKGYDRYDDEGNILLSDEVEDCTDTLFPR